MRLDVDTNKPKPEIVASHKGRQLIFPANIFTRKPFSETDVYREINAYWESMPPEFQDEVFSIYEKVNQAFEEIFVSEDLSQWLSRCIEELHRLHPLSHLQQWLSSRGVRIPSSVKDNPPAANDVINTAEKTYTRKEYFGLISLAMFLRTITPIWGEYIGSIRRDTGIDRKEYVSFQLLVNTGILETEEMKKLTTYIKHLTQTVHWDESKIIRNFSSDDIVFLYLALTCIRKICVADISGDEEVSSIVAVMFKFIRYRINSVDSNRIVIKEENGGDSDAGKHSLLESYRKRLELSSGERAELVFMLSQPEKMARYIQPDIPQQLLEQCISTSSILKYEELADIQLYLAGMLIKPCVTPSAVFYCEADVLAPLLGAMEAVLWHRGHKYLALLMSSRLISNVEEIVISNIHSREQISQEKKEKLFQWFPYQYGYVKKGRGQDNCEMYSILTSIDYIVDEFVNNSFRASASENKLIEVFGEIKRRIPIFSNIRQLLAEAIIDNEERIDRIEKDPLAGFVIPEQL